MELHEPSKKSSLDLKKLTKTLPVYTRSIVTTEVHKAEVKSTIEVVR